MFDGVEGKEKERLIEIHGQEGGKALIVADQNKVWAIYNDHDPFAMAAVQAIAKDMGAGRFESVNEHIQVAEIENGE